ncbi:UNKNOWN [Stylonychia lemnae]|uniref:N-formylglutamate amidohydrolase n=1 Tax=Stylonychia lemnae TaxID=5949 RepID=A0A078AKA6_STYLE|nr:UNKNOWN [Stylonychia lemnae]|eukprot:CDW81872.1 UNKNOWN [Stylonychia lemnae]
MESRNQINPGENHVSKYVASVNGPIIFTAPHSGKLKRGGAEYDEKRRVHQREKYTSALALKFAIEVGNQSKDAKTGRSPGPLGSFCFWSKDHKLNEVDLDPNYLYSGNIMESPFHQYLHLAQDLQQGVPLFHIDIHGKLDRKDCYDLDLGIECAVKHWEGYGEQDFLNAFINKLKSGFNEILKNIPKYKGFEAKCNENPYLNGNWGGDLKTMNEQAIVLGIPSIQLEIPFTMRAYLFKDDQFAKSFVKVLLSTYREVIVNWWPAKSVPQLFDPRLGALVRHKKYNKQEADLLNQQYVEWEKKPKATDKYI